MNILNDPVWIVVLRGYGHSSLPPVELSPKNRSKKALSLVSTRCFFSPCPPSAENRETGGSTLVIAVPVVWIAPSRKAASNEGMRLVSDASSRPR